MCDQTVATEGKWGSIPLYRLTSVTPAEMQGSWASYPPSPHAPGVKGCFKDIHSPFLVPRPNMLPWPNKVSWTEKQVCEITSLWSVEVRAERIQARHCHGVLPRV